MRNPCPFRRTWRPAPGLLARIFVFTLFLAAINPFFDKSVLAQQGAMTVPMDLARMVDESENILLARVTDVKGEKHPDLTNLDTVVVTLDVIEPLKGGPGRQYTFRQFVFDPRDKDSKLGYRVGEEVVLMLRQPSQYKLTSPVGMEQGRFTVEHDAQGNRLLRNGLNNAGLFDGATKTVPNLTRFLSPGVQQLTTQHRTGPITYEDFRTFVQGVLAARQAGQ